MATPSISDTTATATEIAMWLIDGGHLDDISAALRVYEAEHGVQDAQVVAQARSFADTYAGELEVSNAYSTYKPARARKTAHPVLYKKEQENAKLVNRAIREGYAFFVCRTLDKKVAKLPLTMLSVNLQTGVYEIVYRKNDELVTENASQIDLTIIQQTARGYAEKMSAAQKMA